MMVACQWKRSSPTGPALQFAGGSLPKSCSSLLMRFDAISRFRSAFPLCVWTLRAKDEGVHNTSKDQVTHTPHHATAHPLRVGLRPRGAGARARGRRPKAIRVPSRVRGVAREGMPSLASRIINYYGFTVHAQLHTW